MFSELSGRSDVPPWTFAHYKKRRTSLLYTMEYSTLKSENKEKKKEK
jgi:hypothetical protein